MDSPYVPPLRPPVLSQFQAFGLLIVYCLIYVLPLHATQATRANPGRSRDAPFAIRARIRSVSLSTALCCSATFILIWESPPDKRSTLHLMGLWPLGCGSACKSLLLTSLLFAGPLYECLIVEGVWRGWLQLEPLRQLRTDWALWRNMVAGPVTEECLFRSSALPLLLMAQCSVQRIIFLSPLVFGLAHAHHFYEFRVTHPHTPLLAAFARSLLQFSYTTIFGAYANFLYLRTGSLLAAIAVHTLCNSMGLPRIWGMLEPHWLEQNSPDRKQAMISWTVPYYVLLPIGTILWWQNLSSLTESGMALVSIGTWY